MIALLAKLFIKDRQNLQDARVRQAYGMLCSIVGVVLNIALFAGKYIAGAISGSIAIVADAFNNLTDAGSSLITLIGFRIGGKKPDLEHPFGHGRFEYISGFCVAVIIFLIGFELGRSSIEKIINPEPVEFSYLVLGILVVSILVKVYMFIYNNRFAKKLASPAMRATGLDSLSDTIATFVVLLAMVIGELTGANIDGWCGVLVALFILYAGFSAAKETLSPLLGQAPAAEFIEKIEHIVLSHAEIVGIHDLVVHDYGPGRCMVSLHGEVNGDGDIYLLHDVIDQAEEELRSQLGCEAVIHMDPIAVNDEAVTKMRHAVALCVKQLGEDVSIHDFRMVQGPSHTNLIFDVVLPHHSELGEEEAAKQVKDLVCSNWPNHYAVVKIDRPYGLPHK